LQPNAFICSLALVKRRLAIMQYTVHLYSYLAIAALPLPPYLSMIFKVYLMRIGGRRRSWRDI
jgi:energy-converting hydrogenase Eha subunit C